MANDVIKWFIRFLCILDPFFYWQKICQISALRAHFARALVYLKQLHVRLHDLATALFLGVIKV